MKYSIEVNHTLEDVLNKFYCLSVIIFLWFDDLKILW